MDAHVYKNTPHWGVFLVEASNYRLELAFEVAAGVEVLVDVDVEFDVPVLVELDAVSHFCPFGFCLT